MSDDSTPSAKAPAAAGERLPPNLREAQAALGRIEPEPNRPEDEEAPKARNLNGTHLFLLSCMALVVGFLGWASIGKLDVVANALGEVTPASQVQSVQHLEGGIVRAIRVREGDRVSESQPLIELEPIRTGAELEELDIRMIALRIKSARLRAEAGGTAELDFTPELRAAEPGLVQSAEQLFETRKRRLAAQIKVQNEQVFQREREIEETRARIANSRRSLDLLAEQLKISERLLKINLTNRMKHIDLLKEQAELRSEISESSTAIERLRSSLTEARSQLTAIKNTFREEARKELEETERTLRELDQRRIKLADAFGRTVLRSPVNGTIKSLYVFTEGGVIQPGRTVLDIVPGDDRLIIEAKLAVTDIGYVRVGQEASMTLTSSDAQRFGYLDGNVVGISPDTFQSEGEAPYYKVRIETEKDHFGDGDLQYQLFPGMQVAVNIMTGTRTVLAYILDPYVKSMRIALRER